MPDGKDKFTVAQSAESVASGTDFETLLRLTSETIIQVAPGGNPMFISPSAEALLGWDETKITEHLSDLVYTVSSGHRTEAEQLHGILSGSLSPSCGVPQIEVQVRSARSPLTWVEMSAFRLTDPTGNTASYAVYLKDISKRKELESLLEVATQTDPLTGLYNRRAFEETLDREWAVSLREKTHTTLIKVSLDKFDALQDQLGQTAADECLSKVAAALKETVRRPADIAARTAGSEFALLLPRTHEMGAETISAYIQVAIEDLAIPNPANSGGNGVVTASVGAACTVANQSGVSESPEYILAAAENCVFQARQEGGNRVKSVMNFLGK